MRRLGPIIAGMVLLLCLQPAMAQSGRGAVTGEVKDSSGAVVPGATITFTNMETGAELTATTTAAGVYRSPYIPPGRYKIASSLTGFKTSVRENVDVHVAQTVTVDFVLEIGQISDTVTVAATAPLLEKSTMEIGTVSTEKEVHTWPILVGDGTRQLQSFIFRAMPGTQGGEWQGSINGSQSFSHEILIDGVSVGRMDINGGNTNEFTPTMDAVSEFKLQTGAISSQYGNTQTGLANFGMKSGTNEYHGSAFWFHQNSALNANRWAANNSGRIDPATGTAFKPKTKLNNWGATFGGPIFKNKTLFFFSYESNRQANYVPRSTYRSSPTAEMKKGDFSRLLDPKFTENSNSGKVMGQDALGRNVIFGQLYDPLSTRQLANGAWVRDPFPGNIIPQTRFSALTTKILNPSYALPDPTFPRRSLVGETLRNNTLRIDGCCPELIINNYSIKIDHVLTGKHKLSGSFTENDRYRWRYGGGSWYDLPGKIPNTPAAGDKRQSTPGQIIRLAEDWTISHTMLNHFGYGYNRFLNQNVSTSYLTGKDWAKEFGLQNVGGGAFPRMSFFGTNTTTSGQFLDWGHQGAGAGDPNGSGIVQDDFTWIKSKHSLRFGVEHRRYYINGPQVAVPPRYSFDSNQTALSGFNQQTGFAFASFILGSVRNASASVPGITTGVRSRTTALYVQDDWKVNSRLTLNLGIRWDIPTGYSNPNNFMSALDPSKPNPGADGYPGALVFLGDCQQCNGKSKWADIYYGEWAPRIGFAYSASNKLVLRGGYGINYAPPLLDGWAYGWFNGFNGSNFIPSKTGRPGGGDDPAYWWDTPYPQYTATLPNYSPTQLNDGSIPYYPPETNKMPRTQNWNFGIQFELPWQTRLEANYVGTRGTHLNEGYKYALDQLDPSYLSLGDALLEDIKLHPEIKKPYASFSGTVAQALRKYPQYRGVTAHRYNGGWSNYHSLQITATKRTSHGLSFLVSYTFSKALATSDDVLGYSYYGGVGQTIYNRKLDYSVSQLNTPQDLKVTWIYDLPFGSQGTWLRSGFLSHVLGGWTVSGIQRYSSGVPLAISNSGGPTTNALFNQAWYVDTLLPRDQQIIGSKPDDPNRTTGTPYLNPGAWGAVPMTPNQVAKRLPKGSRFLPNLRGFARGSEDFSIIKRSRMPFINEVSNFEFRADMTNIFNRTWVNNPRTDIGVPAEFGRVFEKYGGGRTIQLGIRITF